MGSGNKPVRVRVYLFLLLSLLVSSKTLAVHHPSSFPENILPRGTYEFQGRVEVELRRTTEILDERKPSERARLQELRAQGTSCTRATGGPVFRCFYFSRDRQPDTEARLAEEHQGAVLTFSPQVAGVDEATPGDMVREWEVFQKFTWHNQDERTRYRFFLLRDQTIKLALPAESEELWLRMGEKGLALSQTRLLRESPRLFHLDYAWVHLSQVSRAQPNLKNLTD